VNKLYILFAFIALTLTSCSQAAQAEGTSTPQGNPAWVDQMIAKFQSDPVGNPPQSIWSYQYKGETVYFIPQQCCDQYSQLFDANGTEICAPDGGIVAGGDGKCPDFFSQRTNEKLVWQDPRTR
jgi:hypothetical protein